MAVVPSIRIRVQTRPKVRIRVTPALIPRDSTVGIGTVTTLAPGASATVVNVGTPSASILNFGLPQGAMGTPGTNGLPGVVQALSGGANISIDSSNPAVPVVAATGLQPLDTDLTSWAAITRASGFDTFVATPSSANLRGVLTDETGTGLAVFGTAPTFTTSLTMTSGVVLGANYMANYTGNLGLITASLQSPLTTNAALYAHGTTTTLNQQMLGQFELISNTISNNLGGAVTLSTHVEATANSGGVWAQAASVALDAGYDFATHTSVVQEFDINNLAGDFSDIAASASLGLFINGLGYRNTAAMYVGNMQHYVVATSATAAGSAVLTFSGGVPAWYKAGGVITNLTNGSVIPAGTTMLSKTATTVTLSANVTGAGVAINDHIQIAQPLFYQGIKFAVSGISQYTINDQSSSNTSLYIAGSHTLGLDFTSATLSSAAVRLGVGTTQGITTRFSGTDYSLIYADAAGRGVIGNTTLGTRFNGTVGIGTDPLSSMGLLLAGNVSNAAGNAYGLNLTPTLFPASGSAGVFASMGGTVATGGNTIAGAYSAYLAAPLKSGGGTITTAYSLFLEAPASGTTNYALYSSGASRFQTTVQIDGTGSSLLLASTAAINFGAGNYTITHSSGALTFSAGFVVAGGVVASGFVGSNGAATGVGYATGAGGTVTQATSKATGVALAKMSGAITMNAAALAAGTIVSFVLTNAGIAATDVLILNHISGGTVGSYSLNAQCAAGSATINVRNNTAGSLSEAVVIQYAVIKAVNA